MGQTLHCTRPFGSASQYFVLAMLGNPVFIKRSIAPFRPDSVHKISLYPPVERARIQSRNMKTRLHVDVRGAAVADRFYPADPAALREMVFGFLAEGQRSNLLPKALIAPHAGFI